jgi:hypothetical protein
MIFWLIHCFKTNADHSLSFIFSNELFNASLEEVTIEIPDTTIKVSFSLETLNLANQSIVFPYSWEPFVSNWGLSASSSLTAMVIQLIFSHSTG